MQKLISITNETEGLTEMMMLEFQGEFEHSSADVLDGLTLGDLSEKPGGNYDLVVGNHLLKGKRL